MVNNVPNKKQNFSIINDIYIYLNNYNLKYKTKLNVHNIIQGYDSDNEIINKVCYYLLDLFYWLEPEDLDNENESEELLYNNDNINLGFTNKEFNDLDNKKEDNTEERDDISEILYFDEFNKKAKVKKS